MPAQMLVVVLLSLVVLGCHDRHREVKAESHSESYRQGVDYFPRKVEHKGEQGYYPGIVALDGSKIPITKLPSILEQGKLIAMCDEGQIPYLDHCFDSIHFEAEQAGFKLESETRTFEAWTTASQTWLDTFTTIETWNGRNLTHGYQLTYKCIAWSSSCAIPSWFRSLKTKKIGKTHYIDYFTLNTHYRWGGALSGRTTHSWPVQGTITMKGKIYPLPVTKKQVKAVYGRSSPVRTASKYLETIFNYDCNSTILPDCPVNDDNKPLMHISYNVDNYQRERYKKNKQIKF